MSEANEAARHFYSTLIDFNLRVGISPVCTLVLPIISKKSPALPGALLLINSNSIGYHSIQSPFGCTQTESVASAVKK